MAFALLTGAFLIMRIQGKPTEGVDFYYRKEKSCTSVDKDTCNIVSTEKTGYTVLVEIDNPNRPYGCFMNWEPAIYWNTKVTSKDCSLYVKCVCAGDGKEEEVDGQWGSWSAGACSATCGEGTLTNTRLCNNPTPSDGGANCVGEATKEVTCNEGPCPENSNKPRSNQEAGGPKATSCSTANDCDAEATCENKICVCKEGFRGSGATDDCVGKDKYKQFDITCSELDVKGEWTRANFGTPEAITLFVGPAQNDDVTKAPEGCKKTVPSGDKFDITAVFSECGAKIEETTQTVGGVTTPIIKQSQVATIEAHYHFGTVNRWTRYKFTMACIFDREKKVSTKDPFNTGVQIKGEEEKTKKTDLQVEMNLMDSSSYTKKKNGYSYTSFQLMFVQIKETVPNENLKFITNECWASDNAKATPVSTPTNLFTYFKDKCPLDPTFKATTTDFAKNEFNYQIQAFNFITVVQKIHLHCKVFICLMTSAGDDCKQECKARRKRRAITDRGSNSPLEERTIVSPLIEYKKTAMCKDIKCKPFSICYERYPAVCRCAENYVEDQMSGECVPRRRFDVQGIRVDVPYLVPYSNPMSRDFWNLAVDFENTFFNLVKGDAESYKVAGMKITRCYLEEATVLDLSVIRSANTTSEEAYTYFMKVVYGKHYHSFKVINDVLPKRIDIIDDTALLMYILVSVAALVLLICCCCCIVVCCRRRKRAKEEEATEGQVNMAADMEMAT